MEKLKLLWFCILGYHNVWMLLLQMVSKCTVICELGRAFLQIEKQKKVHSNWNDRARFRTVYACAEVTVFKVGKSKLFAIAALEVYKWQRSLKKTV